MRKHPLSASCGNFLSRCLSFLLAAEALADIALDSGVSCRSLRACSVTPSMRTSPLWPVHNSTKNPNAWQQPLRCKPVPIPEWRLSSRSGMALASASPTLRDAFVSYPTSAWPSLFCLYTSDIFFRSWLTIHRGSRPSPFLPKLCAQCLSQALQSAGLAIAAATAPLPLNAFGSVTSIETGYCHVIHLPHTASLSALTQNQSLQKFAHPKMQTCDQSICQHTARAPS